jgi:hypothetical protein
LSVECWWLSIFLLYRFMLLNENSKFRIYWLSIKIDIDPSLIYMQNKISTITFFYHEMYLFLTLLFLRLCKIARKCSTPVLMNATFREKVLHLRLWLLWYPCQFHGSWENYAASNCGEFSGPILFCYSCFKYRFILSFPFSELPMKNLVLKVSCDSLVGSKYERVHLSRRR